MIFGFLMKNILYSKSNVNIILFCECKSTIGFVDS